MQYLWFPFATGLLLSFVLTGLSLWVFPRLGWLDFPERYGLNRPRLPYPGGLVLWGLILLGLCFVPSFKALLAPIFMLGLVSWWDDRKQLPAWFRLLVHVWLGLWLVLQGIQIYFISHPFLDTNIELAALFPQLAVILTIVWVVSIQNALNWFDGLPGLSVGVSGVGFLTIGLLGISRPELWQDPAHYPLTMFSFYMAALCVGAFGFYLKNKLILGDTGSQVLGWLLAVLAIFSGAKIATTIIVLSLPLIDFAWVIFRRMILEKKSPFKGDFFHLHHLLANHLRAEKTVLMLVLTSFLLGLVAVFLSGTLKLVVLFVLLGSVLSLNWWLWRAQKY